MAARPTAANRLNKACRLWLSYKRVVFMQLPDLSRLGEAHVLNGDKIQLGALSDSSTHQRFGSATPLEAPPERDPRRSERQQRRAPPRTRSQAKREAAAAAAAASEETFIAYVMSVLVPLLVDSNAEEICETISALCSVNKDVAATRQRKRSFQTR